MLCKDIVYVRTLCYVRTSLCVRHLVCVRKKKKKQESISRCTGLRDITEIRLKTALNTKQSIGHIIVMDQ